MTLNLVKGEFSTLEDALRKQVQVLEEENNRLDEKIFLLDQENKLNVAELTELKTHNEKLQRQVHVLTHERDEWRSRYEHTLAANVIPSWVSSPKPSDE